MVEEANSGASVLCLCEKGDAMIMEETGKIFKKEKEMKKGEAFVSSPGFSIWSGSSAEATRAACAVSSAAELGLPSLHSELLIL